jgi:hypothetical protein
VSHRSAEACSFSTMPRKGDEYTVSSHDSGGTDADAGATDAEMPQKPSISNGGWASLTTRSFLSTTGKLRKVFSSGRVGDSGVSLQARVTVDTEESLQREESASRSHKQHKQHERKRKHGRVLKSLKRANRFWFMSPTSTTRQAWDVLTILMTMYTGLVTPVQVGVLRPLAKSRGVQPWHCARPMQCATRRSASWSIWRTAWNRFTAGCT